MSDKIVLSDELTKLVDRLLVDAFTAGANGDDFDMLAANRAVAEAAIAADRAARAEAVVPEYDRNAYEELRAIIDGGSEGHMIGWNDFQTGWEAAMEAQRAANAQVMGTMHEVLDSLVEVVAVSDKHAIILGITPAPDSPIQRAKHAIVKARAWLAAAHSGEQRENVELPPIYYMRDNHTFRRLSDYVRTALVEIEAEFNAGWTNGTLCSKRTGFKPVHAEGSTSRIRFFKECEEALIAAMKPRQRRCSMSQQKMREALDAICSAKLCSINSMSSRVEMLRLMDLAIDKLREALAAPVEPSGNSGEFAAPAGEQVGLTDAEIVEVWRATPDDWTGNPDCTVFARAVIAAHEAKRNGGAA